MKVKALLLVAQMMMATLIFGNGIEWKTEVRTEPSKGKPSVMIITSAAQAGNVRQDFQMESGKASPLHRKDVYWLFQASDRMLYVVDKKEKTITPMSLDQMMAMAQAMGQVVRIEIEDYTVKREALPDGTVLGHPCRHVRLVTDYTMKMKVAFIKKTVRVHQDREIWGCAKLSGMDQISTAFRNKEWKTGLKDLDELIAKEMAAMGDLGFVLKQVTQEEQFNKKGKSQGLTRTTMEVTELNPRSFDAAHFALPEGYKMAALPGAEAEEQDSDEEEAPKKKRGLRLPF